MKKLFLTLSVVFAAMVSAYPADYNIKAYGAKGNGKTDNTEAFTKAIADCNNAGGGRVIVPAGDWMTETIELLDNVELHLEEGANIIASHDISTYRGYVCTREGFEKYKMAYAQYWNKAVIFAVGRRNIAITGSGTISGENVTNPQGEDKIRGPHTIVLAECTNFTLRGFTVERAGNYAFMGYELKNGVFENLKMKEGYDGIHIRGGKNIVIRNCRIETGDDAIAGGHWDNFVITDCHINSTCNGIRIIYPVSDLEICHNVFKGPGVYPHRSVKNLQGKRLMMAAINLQPGAWQATEGPVEKVYVHDLEVDNVRCVFHADLKTSTWGEDILLERIKATNIYHASIQFHSWKGGTFDNVTLRDIDVEYVGRTDDEARNAEVKAPSIEAIVLPYWAFFGRNIRSLQMENVNFSYKGEECRTAIGFDNIADIRTENVSVQEVEGKDTIDPVNCYLSPQNLLKKFIPLR